MNNFNQQQQQNGNQMNQQQPQQQGANMNQQQYQQPNQQQGGFNPNQQNQQPVHQGGGGQQQQNNFQPNQQQGGFQPNQQQQQAPQQSQGGFRPAFAFGEGDKGAPSGGFSLIPAGVYGIIFTSAEVKDNKSGGGRHLSMQCEIIEGKSKNRKLFVNFNIEHSNPKACEVAWGHLEKLHGAIGMQGWFNNPAELTGKPLLAKIEQKAKWNDPDTMQNEIYGYGYQQFDRAVLEKEQCKIEGFNSMMNNGGFNPNQQQQAPQQQGVFNPNQQQQQPNKQQQHGGQQQQASFNGQQGGQPHQDGYTPVYKDNGGQQQGHDAMATQSEINQQQQGQQQTKEFDDDLPFDMPI